MAPAKLGAYANTSPQPILPTLWQYLQSILSYLVPPVAAVFMLGIFWRRANEAGALLTLSIAVPLGAAGWIMVELLQ